MQDPNQTQAPFALPSLPFPKDALAPVLSAECFDYHHGKHHNAYVVKLNELVAGQPPKDLVTLIRENKGGGPIFNNAAQVWNHTFFWNCMKPNGGGDPPKALGDAIAKEFGSLADFKTKFQAAAVGQFGSGWAWLVKGKDGKLSIETTANAGTPIVDEGKTPLLTLDVWEHAYYIDFRNARPKFAEEFWKIVDWGNVAARFGG
jgi:superoxide dismutase, Fe-Mn family